MSRNRERGTLGEQLNAEMLSKLRSKKSEWKQQEEERIEKEKQRRIEERKHREANKSFEELLNESDMDWKNFKK